MGHMVVSKERLADTVHTMESTWHGIVDDTGDLTPADMLRTLRRAKYNGEDVVVPGNEDALSLRWMNAYLIGDEDVTEGAYHG